MLANVRNCMCLSIILQHISQTACFCMPPLYSLVWDCWFHTSLRVNCTDSSRSVYIQNKRFMRNRSGCSIICTIPFSIWEEGVSKSKQICDILLQYSHSHATISCLKKKVNIRLRHSKTGLEKNLNNYQTCLKDGGSSLLILPSTLTIPIWVADIFHFRSSWFFSG